MLVAFGWEWEGKTAIWGWMNLLVWSPPWSKGAQIGNPWASAMGWWNGCGFLTGAESPVITDGCWGIP